MKTILITISKGVIRRNILDTDFWPEFIKKNKDTKVIFLVTPGRKDYFEEHFGGENVLVKETKKEKVSLFYKFVMFLVRTGINSHSVTLYRKRAYTMNQANLLKTVVKELISFFPARFNFYKHFVRFLVQRLKTLSWIKEYFDEFQPNLVFAPSLIDINIDVPIALEAKKRNIKVIGMVRSWDNLNNHGLMPVIPDRFILQNIWLKEASWKFQAIDVQKLPIDIIGLPHYDRYKDPTPMIVSKEEFFKDIGIDPNKKTIFMAGFDFYFSENTLPKLFDELIESGEIDDSVQVIFTRHPSSPFEVSDYNFDNAKHVTYYDFFGKSKISFDNTEEIFINLMYHADVVINIASTVSIDCAIFNKPTICISFDDPKKNLPYWKSVHRLHDSFDHYEKLISSGGVKLPKSPKEMTDYINRYLKDPSLEKEDRKKILDFFVEPFDGKAGLRLAEILSEEISKL